MIGGAGFKGVQDQGSPVYESGSAMDLLHDEWIKWAEYRELVKGIIDPK